MILARIRKQITPGPGQAPVALDVDFQTSAGVTAVFGPSGSGKSFLLEAIAGFARPAEGRILLDDEIVFDGATGVHVPPRRRHCGFVPRGCALFPHMTVRENLAFAAVSASRSRLPRLERHRAVNQMLERFGLAAAAPQLPASLGPGERLRCAIARALVAAPRLLILDQPSHGLDAPARAQLCDALRTVRAGFRVPVLLSSHDPEVCLEVADQVLVIAAGRLLESGPAVSVFDAPRSVETARLLGNFNLLPVEITALDPGRKTSRLRLGDSELAGPYFPGRLRGDRVWLCIRPAELRAVPRDGKAGPNQVLAELVRVGERPRALRLEFTGGILVDMDATEFERYRHNKEWLIDFPSQGLRIL